MKRITLAAALLAAAACAACQPTTGPNANQPAGNSTPQSTPTPAPTVSAGELIDREKQLSEAVRSKNLEAFSASVTDDMLYVTADGTHDKTQTLDILRKLELTEYTLTDFKVVVADKDAAVVTYTSNIRGSYDGQPLPPGMQYESSAWVNRGGRWLNVYHQDTLVLPTPPPTPSPTPAAATAASPSATAAATPAATPPPAGATLADMERYVWDMFARRDWDAFAALLPEDFIEVEPSGVMNKAQSVAGIRQTDFANFSLSDFREIKFDADAGLVTYVVKGPRDFGPQGMRHTTVYANRNGRWLPIFHQGTLVEQ